MAISKWQRIEEETALKYDREYLSEQPVVSSPLTDSLADSIRALEQIRSTLAMALARQQQLEAKFDGKTAIAVPKAQIESEIKSLTMKAGAG